MVRRNKKRGTGGGITKGEWRAVSGAGWEEREGDERWMGCDGGEWRGWREEEKEEKEGAIIIIWI